jgi:hypothetical protein
MSVVRLSGTGWICGKEIIERRKKRGGGAVLSFKRKNEAKNGLCVRTAQSHQTHPSALLIY